MHKLDKYELIKSVPFFGAMPAKVIDELVRISSVISVSKGEYLFYEGENPRGMFILAKGAVKIFKYSTEGREQVLTVEKPVGIIAELPLLDGQPYPANALALEDCCMLLIPKDEFLRIVQKRPELALAIIKNLSIRLRHLVMLIEEISFLDVYQRLAKYLLKESKGRTEFTITHTNTEVASIIGTVRELVSRNLSRLVNEGVIELEGKKVRIIDEEKLKELAFQ